MKKKLISLLTAGMLVMSMGSIAFAAESPSAGQVSDITKNPTQEATVDKAETKAPEDYLKDTTVKGNDKDGQEVKITVSAVSKDTVETTANEVDAQLKDIENIADLIDAPELKAAAKNANKTIVPEIKTVVNVKVEGMEVTKENPITLTLSADVSEGDAVLVLHWNGTAWEAISPDAVLDGSVVVTLTSLSPVAIVKLNVKDAAVIPSTPAEPNPNPGQNAGNATTGANGSAAGTNGATAGTTATKTSTTATAAKATKTATAATTKKSPKTGMETSVLPMFAAIFAAAGFACTRKAKNN